MNFMAKGWEVSGEYRQVPHLSCIGEFYGEGVGEVLQKSWASLEIRHNLCWYSLQLEVPGTPLALHLWRCGARSPCILFQLGTHLLDICALEHSLL